MNRKRLIIVADVLVVLVVVFSLSVYLNRKLQEQTTPAPTSASNAEPITGTTTVTYDNNGFSPQQITVAKGTTVNFDNKTEIPMWVASDPHPEHFEYPEFDVIRTNGGQYPEPKNDFSFTFDKSGAWKYHNHTMPGHMATITVK